MRWVLLGTAGASRCWSAGFDEQRCCVENDPICWDTVYTYELCCGEGDGKADLDAQALDDLLELHARGRVRPTAELKAAVGGVHPKDSETEYLKELLLEKIGATQVT